MNQSSRRAGPVFGFALLFAALVVVFVAVLEKRFASGDIYPHYSTLRTDPLGGKALFDSLAALPGLEVSRNQRSLMSIDSLDGESALWLSGLSRTAFGEMRAPKDSPVLRAIKEDGARLIITINPEAVPEKFDLAKDEAVDDWLKRRERIKEAREALKKAESDDPEKEADEATGEKSIQSDSETRSEPKAKAKGKTRKIEDELEEAEKEWEEAMTEQMGPPLAELLEVQLKTPDTFTRPEVGWTVKSEKKFGEPPVPAELPLWRSQYRFDKVGGAWRIAATVDGEPVVIERAFGKGSILLATDAYFSSNEALWQGADPDFLLWLTGGKTRLIFDETIHGSVESGGVMKMIRRYRFHGFFLGFFLFVALLAWRSASPLAPGSEAVERGLISGSSDAIAGEDTSSGFIRLLRRSVPSRRLLRTCLETWRTTASRRFRGETTGQREAIEAALAGHERSPGHLPASEAYRQIASVLSHPDVYREKPMPESADRNRP